MQSSNRSVQHMLQQQKLRIYQLICDVHNRERPSNVKKSNGREPPCPRSHGVPESEAMNTPIQMKMLGTSPRKPRRFFGAISPRYMGTTLRESLRKHNREAHIRKAAKEIQRRKLQSNTSRHISVYTFKKGRTTLKLLNVFRCS